MTIIGAAAFASLPGLLIDPLHQELHWSRGTIGMAVSLNLALYGLTAPFAAALNASGAMCAAAALMAVVLRPRGAGATAVAAPVG